MCPGNHFPEGVARGWRQFRYVKVELAIRQEIANRACVICFLIFDGVGIVDAVFRFTMIKERVITMIMARVFAMIMARVVVHDRVQQMHPDGDIQNHQHYEKESPVRFSQSIGHDLYQSPLGGTMHSVRRNAS